MKIEYKHCIETWYSSKIYSISYPLTGSRTFTSKRKNRSGLYVGYHRSIGPAIEKDHYNEWAINGNNHRIDGPSVIDKRGRFTVGKKWFYKGRYLDCEEQYWNY